MIGFFTDRFLWIGLICAGFVFVMKSLIDSTGSPTLEKIYRIFIIVLSIFGLLCLLIWGFHNWQRLYAYM